MDSLIGETKNFLTCVGLAERPEGDNRRGKFYNFLCVCGNYRVMLGYFFTTGKGKSCGCKNIFRKSKKLVRGVGINDAPYPVNLYKKVDGKKVLYWACPFYLKWVAMLDRCYNEAIHKRQPNYIGCSVVPEWHYFMNFRSWMEKQDWEGKELDKDLLIPNNKVYGPTTCCFLSNSVNSFMTEGGSLRNGYKAGVSFENRCDKFRAHIRDSEKGKGSSKYFLTEEEAHQDWLANKIENAKFWAEKELDERLGKALIDRYTNYEKYFGADK